MIARPRRFFRLLIVPIFGLALLLGACGGGAAAVQEGAIVFPNTLNYPKLPIKDRVVNLNGRGGFQYVKLSLSVVFADPNGQFLKSKGEGYKKIEDGFVADHQNLVDAFNDVLTNDLSTKTPQELQTPSGKEALRQQLIKDFNARLAEPPRVLWVEFTDFVMQ